MKKLVLVVALSLVSCAAWANPPGSGETNGNGCVENCGNGGSNGGGSGGSGGTGGNGGNGGVGGSGGSGVGIATSVAGASSASSSLAGASASNIANGGAGGSSGSNHNDIRSFALSGGSVGSPSNDTCASNASIFFGLATFPVTIKTCLAERQALLLWSFGQKDAALERLCAIPEVAETSACPKKPLAIQ